MDPVTSPHPPTAQDSSSAIPDVRGPIIGFMLKRGSRLGILVGVVTGTYTASRLLYGAPGGEFGVLVIGPVIGAAAGFFLGVCIALLEALILARLAPVVRSRNFRATWAVVLAASVAVALVLGVTLLFLGSAWSGALVDPLVIAVWAVSAWLGGIWVGTGALYSALNPLP